MGKIIEVTELRQRFRSVFDEVAEENVPYVLTRDSRPEVAMISYEDFLRFQAMQEEEILARFNGLIKRMATHNADFTDEEVAADVEAARTELNVD